MNNQPKDINDIEVIDYEVVTPVKDKK